MGKDKAKRKASKEKCRLDKKKAEKQKEREK